MDLLRSSTQSLKEWTVPTILFAVGAAASVAAMEVSSDIERRIRARKSAEQIAPLDERSLENPDEALEKAPEEYREATQP